jgi:hypothetical protein
MKAVPFAASIVAVAGAFVPAAAAGPVRLTARPTPAQEVPKQAIRNPKATGTFFATLEPAADGYRLAWRLTFAKLSGRATSAIIHLGKPGAHGAAMAVLCSPCASGARGSAYFSPPELVLARAGKLYVNIRTTRNPSGEIRGQIAVG